MGEAKRRYKQLNLMGSVLNVSGDWGDAIPRDVLAVISSARKACIGGINFPAGAPIRIDVVGIPSRSCPMVHAENRADGSAKILLTVNGRQWAQLAYQFGHELGHVAANSWKGDAIPKPPSHWIEEALVEAFSIFGLLRMEQLWAAEPPYPSWNTYGQSLGDYARCRLAELGTTQHQKVFDFSPSAWFNSRRSYLEVSVTLTQEIWPIIPLLVETFHANTHSIIELTELNKWPNRSSVPIDDYLNAWETSCIESALAGNLPKFIRSLFNE